jgi:subtilisin family serine protease
LKKHFAVLGNQENAINHVYENVLKGFGGRLSDDMLRQLRMHENVSYVEADQVVSIEQCSTQTGATWGIDRIGERALQLDGTFTYPSGGGNGVDAYIIDTGVQTTHNEFSGGRAIWGANYADNSNTDCNGHGTHVAGTVAGTIYGVAKRATVIAVKVLTCAGSGTNQGVIAGVDYTVTSRRNRGNRPSVANMSLGGGASAALDQSVSSAIASGISFAIAAGNSNTDACSTSPARVSTAITVVATTVVDQGANEIDARASFSNFGSCTHIAAPGELITSAWIGSNTATRTISGTSMAAPHVCGAAAMYLANNPSASPAQVKTALTSASTPNVIDLRCTNTNCQQSPNLMTYSTC